MIIISISINLDGNYRNDMNITLLVLSLHSKKKPLALGTLFKWRRIFQHGVLCMINRNTSTFKILKILLNWIWIFFFNWRPLNYAFKFNARGHSVFSFFLLRLFNCPLVTGVHLSNNPQLNESFFFIYLFIGILEVLITTHLKTAIIRNFYRTTY